MFCYDFLKDLTYILDFLDSGDIMSKLLQSLVKSNKKTTDPKKHLVGQPESDLAESVSRRLVCVP